MATGTTANKAGKAGKAHAPGATGPAPAAPLPPAGAAVAQTRGPIADILAPLTGMPKWLEDVLLAAGLLAGTAYATEPVAVLARRRRQRSGPAVVRQKMHRRKI